MTLFTEDVGFEQQVLIITVTLYITKVIRCLSCLVYDLKQSSNAIWSRKDEGWWALKTWKKTCWIIELTLVSRWVSLAQRDTEGITREVNTEPQQEELPVHSLIIERLIAEISPSQVWWAEPSGNNTFIQQGRIIFYQKWK